ncbi:MAG: DUF4468 domain-containing protein [Bacteroidia bacterium]|nr:DUF4468 domain-containing protein [Bacteroidia bacterium]
MSRLLHIIFFAATLSFAQLPTDQDAKVVFVEVVKADSLSKGDLFHNARVWTEALDKKLTITYVDSVKGELSGHGSLLIYYQQGVFRKLSGRVSFAATVEVKDGKYRYTFTDFVYHYYERDRYYNMVETNRTKKLEDEEAAGWQKKWEQCRVDTQLEIKGMIASLDKRMKAKPQQGQTKPGKLDW